jgi:hypothetical protein
MGLASPGLQADDMSTPTNATTTAEAPREDTRRLLQSIYDKAEFGKWLDSHRVTIWGHVDQGVTGNFDDPNNRLNFGRLFDDRANDYRLNQALLTVDRVLAPEEGKFDWGFRAQFLYGSDARFIHTLGVLDNVTDDTIQPDIVEAFGTAHFPVLTKGGLDLKIGQFVTLMGAEVIDAEGNQFYSHSYIFNFGIPFKHVGVLLTEHATDQFDVMLGVVRGINTGAFDNNDNPAFHGGLSWKTKDGKVAIMGSVHVGPEDSEHGTKAVKGLEANTDLRVIGSAQITIKPTDKLAFITDANYGEDEGFHAEWYGVAQYATYQLTPWLSVGARGEAFRDDDGFAVAAFKRSDDFINLERGQPAKGAIAGKDTTYTELTLGLNVTPCKYAVFRPEVRWDWSGGGNHPFNDGKDSDMFTLAMDVILKF